MDNLTLCTKYTDLPDRLIIRRTPSRKTRVSYGAIVCCDNSWLMVRRRVSIEFSIIVNGKYKKSELKNLIKKISLKERNMLDKTIHNEMSFTELFKYVNHYIKNLDHALFCFGLFREILLSLINTECCKGTEYYWPKGRSENINETNMETCIRETLEETGVDISKGKLADIIPIVDRFIGYNNIIYENYFWVFVIDKKKETCIKSVDEISEAIWVTSEKVPDYISPDKLQTFICAKKLIS